MISNTLFDQNCYWIQILPGCKQTLEVTALDSVGDFDVHTNCASKTVSTQSSIIFNE